MSTRPIDMIGAELSDILAPLLRAGGEYVDTTLEANKAIDADRKYLDAATEALFTAYYATNGDPANIAKAQAAKGASDQAASVAAQAGQGLSVEAKKRRVEAANVAATEATQAALKAATDAAALSTTAGTSTKASKDALEMAAQKASARAKAATVVAQAAAAGGAPVPLPAWDPKDSVTGQSFWDRKIVGPFTGTHVALAGAAGGLFLAFKKGIFG